MQTRLLRHNLDSDAEDLGGEPSGPAKYNTQKPMKLLVLTVSLIIVLAGCSRSSDTPFAGTSKTNDLGKVVVADGGSYDYALSGNRNCRVSLTALTNQEVMVELVVLETNAQGSTRILARPRIVTKMGERVSMAIGEESVSLIPEVKPSAN